MKKRIIRLALAQIRCELLNKEINLKRVISTIEEVKTKGTDYVLFPELFLSGYMMSPKLFELAESINGESIKKISAAAKHNNIGVVIGFPELDNDKLYNSAAFIDKDGKLVSTYRKTHLYHTEHNYFHAGNDFPIVHLAEGKIGMLITYDMEFPEAPRFLAKKGADIILVLEANMVPYQNDQHIFLHSRALENHIFMAATNKVGLHIENVFFGESQVVHPNGNSLYKAGNNEELPVIEINLEETVQSRGVLNYLKNRRKDLYGE